ncbi:SusC/RagA family TonB-linked outer membrane protein [Catalinimonas alkaloidigena]|uniref:SusC/RagA family TonB-linked outer membrane protein n=1 Tax=Catalinimonas alkaloidigena TaxID=1075417 RepID=UPI0024051287|nr:TonB-dependent receptor [Catalinimonas alkaloidigena]
MAVSVTYAQQKTITGKITDSEGDALPGVTVLEKGTTNGTVTNVEGDYRINLRGEGSNVLVFSSIGYLSQEVEVGNRNTIDVSLEVDTKQLEEVVVVGYGTQKRANVTGAIGSISSENLNNVTTANSAGLIQGKVAGVRVENGGGAPGAGVNIVIRGSGTLGNDQPLYVIDGNITNSMSFLNPNDIESVEVLKDAAAAAIYGNRAANGVIIVTTKRGSAGETQINFSSKFGTQGPTSTFDFLNARQYADYRNLANDNDGQPRALANDAEFDPSVDTDWQDLSINPAPVTDLNLSISGGNENTTFYISSQYFDQEGIVVDSDFKRYNFRANSSFTKGRFKIEESLSLAREVNNPNTYFGRERGELPTIPVYDETNDGGFAGIEPAYHGVARGINWYGLAKLNDNRYTTDGILGNVSAQYEFIDGLTYKLNVGIDYTVAHNYNFTPTFFFSTSQEAFNDVADLNENVVRSLGSLVENTLNYNKAFGKHNIDLLAGFTQQVGESRSVGAQVTDFATNDLRVVDAANEEINSTGNLQQYALQSVLGRVNYNYDGKYLLSATIRRDGSSRFTEENRYGTFPSISLGWRVSDEAFFPEGFVSDLKLRGSYGELGSQNIGNYVTITGLNIYTDYFFDGGRQSGTALTNFANPNVVWETTKTTDIGADIGLMDDKISITLDYFNKRSEDILTDLPIPVYGGVGSSITQNAATIENRGFEFSGTYNHLPVGNGLQFSVTANFTVLDNEVIKLGEGVSPISGGGFTQQSLVATRTEAGYPLGSFYGHVVEGIYQTQEEINADGRANAQLGDLNFVDLDEDGNIDNDDRTFLGDPIPDFEYGMIFNATYKNFNLSMFLQGVEGVDIWNAKKFQFIFDDGGNKITDVLDAWTPENTNTNIPRATVIDPANNKRSSSFYVEDGSYLRLKSIQLSYDLPSLLTDKIGIGNARVSISGQNLLTLTQYSGYDPEIGRNSGTKATGLFGAGVDVEAYPQARSVFLGLDISF